MDYVIELVDVHKKLGRKQVLAGVNLQVSRGETMVIIGRSGTGKSVMLKHIIGLLAPDAGKVFVDGVNVLGGRREDLLKMRARMGVLFQSGALIHWMTVAENVALPLRELGGYEESQIRGIVEEKLDLVELRGSGNLTPDKISGGMQKRAALARAIVRDPEIILYDEPTAGLDPVTGKTIDELIVSIQRRLGVTSVVVTHDMDSAYGIADRIAMLHNGLIMQVGTPDEIRNSTEPAVRQFIEARTSGPLTDDSST
ncbi:MAG TPA: ABC transporter ATP-binding protein [Planctomycetota bacterium]|nr:ABC transporter ATP-binding protein [Planctomycetota bacterium]